MTVGNKTLLLQLVLRSLGLQGQAGSLVNVSKRDLTIVLAAIRRLLQEK
jgi:hypothetical protein